MDLSPASWIWFPSRRTLPNTFVLFRRTIELDRAPSRAAGWITADSRYRLTVNGTRVQWGPAPCDPRELDVDPVDLAPHLRAGTNVIGVEVLFYGLGEGTWVAGKPGLLCHFELEDTRGRLTQIVSDETWQTFLDRAHRPGQYKRWFLRALQEEFDARLHPHGWDTPAFVPGAGWLPAMRLDAPADKPSACGRYFEYLGGDSIPAASAALRERGIPPLREIEVPALRLADAGRVTWWRDPLDWFECRTPDSFQITREPIVVERGAGRWELLIPPINVGTFERSNVPTFNAAYVTFQLAEQVVGWPFFTIDAPAGTIVELICQESHDPARTAWLDSHFYAWSRFVCREGVNRFETFDFESLRWMQLHVRLPDDRRPTTDDRRPTTDNVVSAPVVGGRRSVVISGVGVRRRMFPWPHQPRIGCDDPALQRLFDAAVNTLHNSAQETCVDGMGRERQQYSGDGGHQLQAIRYTFGETRLPRRFLATFGAGLTADGYFLDCWPAYDRLARLAQRQIGATQWGPLLDHGVGFGFDCWQHCLETGDLDALRAPYPRLQRFVEYLEGLAGADGLLPVEGLGAPAVWIDHDAYRQQRHKQCAFNLYAAAMLRHALAPIARAFGDDDRADRYVNLSETIQSAATDRFWSAERGLFVDNLPWLDQDGAPALSDRALATAILYDQCPSGSTDAAVRALVECPPELGRSYPANAIWRYRALARLGRIDVVLDELRARWATMASVIQNNTIQEFWEARPDTADQWSHCAVAPIVLLFAGVAGIEPVEQGFARCRVRPQLGDLGRLELTAHTVRGPIRFRAERAGEGHQVALALPPDCAGELLLPERAQTDLRPIESRRQSELKAYQLAPGTEATCWMPGV